MPPSDYPPPRVLSRFRHEFEVAGGLDHPKILKTYALEQHERRPVLVIEDFGAVSLRDYLQEKAGGLPVAQALNLSLGIAAAVAAVHDQVVIHKDIKPDNILYNEEQGEVKLADFSISTRLERENSTVEEVRGMEGTFAYVSPEQTGRMNRALDYRTDFYSLGATMFELFTGRPPFLGNDPLELVHCHIARQPEDPCALNPDLPRALGRIVLKLLSKNAEDRYQSARGLIHDLKLCIEQLEKNGTIEDFEPGQEDFSTRFQMSHRLYGRDEQIARLMEHFEQARAGRAEALMVGGYSGIGKSALINEVDKPIVASRGLFLHGKYEQFKRNIPYSALLAAFQAQLRRILGEQEAGIEAWRRRLVAALGVNARVMIDVLPELELILGTQPPVPELEPTEAQNRFKAVFIHFVQVFARPEQPLVLFIDDLQWADTPTLNFLRDLLLDAETGYLLLIGAYRDNEVDDSHPLILTLKQLEAKGKTFGEIHLTPLKQEDVVAFVADCLHARPEDMTEFADLIMAKTHGNPFFIRQFLQTLYLRRVLKADVEQRRWTFDMNEIAGMSITENVVDLMSQRLRDLPDRTRSALQIAACAGASFRLKLISLAAGTDEAALKEDFLPAMQEGLIVRAEDSEEEHEEFRFLHDRIQQAAYGLMNEADRKETHLRLGRLLLETAGTEHHEEAVFEIASQFNSGSDLLTDPAERAKVAGLNLEAAQRARLATAYQPAIRFFKAGIALLPASMWADQYELAFPLHRHLADCYYLVGEFDESEKLIFLLLEQARTVVEKGDIMYLQMTQYITQSRQPEGIEVGRKAAALMGIEIPPDDELGPAVAAEFEAAARALGDRKIEDLYDEPEVTDPLILQKLAILSVTMITAYHLGNAAMVGFVTAREAAICLEHGNSMQGAYIYSIYGMSLAASLKEYKTGYEFGKLGARLAHKTEWRPILSKTLLMHCATVQPWMETPEAASAALIEGYNAGIETGELIYSGFCPAFVVRHEYMRGEKNLEQIFNENVDYLKYLERLGDAAILGLTAASVYALAALMGRTKAPWSLSFEKEGYPAFNEEEHVPGLQKPEAVLWLSWYLSSKLPLLVMGEEYAAAFALAVQGRQVGLRDVLYGHLSGAEFLFYSALTAAAHMDDAGEEERTQCREIIAEAREAFGLWQEKCNVDFFKHRALLIEAEAARLEGELPRAIDLYNRAIQSARETGYVQIEGLAYRTAARAFLRNQQTSIAAGYLEEARTRFAHWGAVAVVKLIDEKYREILKYRADEHRGYGTATLSVTSSSSTSHGTTHFDVQSILKSSQAISGEIVLERLLERMLSIVVENAGARRGVLIVERRGQWQVLAEKTIERDDPIFHAERPLAQAGAELPVGIVNFAIRTKEPVVLGDAQNDPRFSGDPYVVAQKARSLLCNPILNQGKLGGVIFLEHNLSSDVFTPDRLEVINMLGSQMAISLENAFLYSNLEEKVEERTRELREAQQRLVELEKEATERQMAGGFAHEMRNALAGSRLILEQALGMTGETPHESMNLQNSRLLKETFLSLRDSLGPDQNGSVLESFKKIFRNEERLDQILRIVYNSTARGLKITKQIMSYSKIGQEEAVRERVDLAGIVARYLEEQREDLAKHRVELALDLNGGVPLDGYENHFYSIISNLVLNARDALLDVRLPADRIRKLSVRVSRDDERALLEVRDNGIGIPEDQLPRIYDAFFSTKPETGTGLGLGTVKKIVQLYAGQIKVDSKAGEGTGFLVSIPLQARAVVTG